MRGLGCCPTAGLGWVAELLNGLEDSLHVAHFVDPQVLQERERGADVLGGGQPPALASKEAAGWRARLQSPAPSALPARARSVLGGLCPLARMSPCLGAREGMVLLILLWAGVRGLASQGARANPLPCSYPLRASEARGASSALRGWGWVQGQHLPSPPPP